jgi:hypothetical protein
MGGSSNDHHEEDPSPLAFRIAVEASAAIISALSVGKIVVSIYFVSCYFSYLSSGNFYYR